MRAYDKHIEHQIAARAYERFLERGAAHGSDVEDWLAAEADIRNGGAFDVVLHEPGSRTIEVMRDIRDFTGLSLQEIQFVIDARPQPLKRVASLHEGGHIVRRLEALGARVELRPTH
jgi:ribosomal protein L7/L12